MDTSIFKAYDIRGVYPDQINEDLVYKIAQAYAKFVNPKKIILAQDVRESSPALWEAASRGLTDAGVDIIDIGIVSTDMMYFATAHLKTDGGIIISASHNPYEDNGIKFFSADGEKFPDDIELSLEHELEQPFTTVDSALMGKAERVEDAAGRYIEFCKGTIPFGTSLGGLILRPCFPASDTMAGNFFPCTKKGM